MSEVMKKFLAKNKKIDYFDIGNGLKLMNILTKTDSGELDRVDTFIGSEEEGFSHGGVVEDVSEPCTIFSYAQFLKMVEYNLGVYLQIFERNTGNVGRGQMTGQQGRG